MSERDSITIVRCDECNGKRRDQSNRRCRGCNGSGYTEQWLTQWRPYEPCKDSQR